MSTWSSRWMPQFFFFFFSPILLAFLSFHHQRVHTQSWNHLRSNPPGHLNLWRVVFPLKSIKSTASQSSISRVYGRLINTNASTPSAGELNCPNRDECVNEERVNTSGRRQSWPLPPKLPKLLNVGQFEDGLCASFIASTPPGVSSLRTASSAPWLIFRAAHVSCCPGDQLLRLFSPSEEPERKTMLHFMHKFHFYSKRSNVVLMLRIFSQTID